MNSINNVALKNRNPICVNISRRTNLIHFPQSRSAVTFILIWKNTMIWQFSEKVEITHRIYPSGNEYSIYNVAESTYYMLSFSYTLYNVLLYILEKETATRKFFLISCEKICEQIFLKQKKKRKTFIFQKISVNVMIFYVLLLLWIIVWLKYLCDINVIFILINPYIP